MVLSKQQRWFTVILIWIDIDMTDSFAQIPNKHTPTHTNSYCVSKITWIFHSMGTKSTLLYIKYMWMCFVSICVSEEILIEGIVKSFEFTSRNSLLEMVEMTSKGCRAGNGSEWERERKWFGGWERLWLLVTCSSVLHFFCLLHVIHFKYAHAKKTTRKKFEYFQHFV